MPVPFDPEVVLNRPLMAHLATQGQDGPRTSPVWFLWEGSALWMLGAEGSSSTERLLQYPSCAVDIVEFDVARGVLLHLGLRGQAEVLPKDPDRFRRLLTKYLGPDPADWNPWFVETVADVENDENRFLKLVPDSVFTNNVSYFRTGPERIDP
jgi:nitroimidazol reductase NimA-like FMN-containing flavoprotein (pyridoxamine 5'-phosphate oxidase superfamily)